MNNNETSDRFMDDLDERIEQQADNIIKEYTQSFKQEEAHDEEYVYTPESSWPEHNIFAIILKVISSIVMLAGLSIGLAVILTSKTDKFAFISVLTGIWIFVGSTVFFLLFYGLGEIISILHDIRDNQ